MTENWSIYLDGGWVRIGSQEAPSIIRAVFTMENNLKLKCNHDVILRKQENLCLVHYLNKKNGNITYKYI